MNKPGYWHGWFLANKDKRQAHQRSLTRVKRDTLRKYKAEKGCADCGNKNPVVLEFHHKHREEKRFEIADRYRMGLETLLLEAEKCEVLCANCHRIREEREDNG